MLVPVGILGEFIFIVALLNVGGIVVVVAVADVAELPDVVVATVGLGVAALKKKIKLKILKRIRNQNACSLLAKV